MISIHKYNESFVFIKCDLDEAINISDNFSFYADNYFWNPKYKAGIWDGKIKLFNIKTGLFPIGLFDDLIKYCKKFNVLYKIIDKELFKKGIKLSNNKIYDFNNKIFKYKHEPYDFQIKAIQLILYHKRCIILSPTASGKSYIAFYLFNILKYKYKDFKFLLIVPNTSLVEQMSTDFEEYAENWCDYSKYIKKIYSGQDKSLERPITISTWQSLQNMPKKFFYDFDCVICDEGHTAKAKELTNIMQNCINAKYKVAMSGTLQDSDIDKLQLNALFGKIYKVAKSKKLMKRGILSNLKIFGIILKYPKKIRELCKKMIWKDEVDFINSREEKIRFILNILKKKNNNSLVLFKSLNFGKKMRKIFKKYLPNNRIFYVDGSILALERERIRKYTEKHNNIIILATFSTFSTGINIKNLHNIFFSESIKSSIKVIQSIGRLLRLHKSKDFAKLYDITDDLSWKKRLNYTLKHFLHRINIYDKEDFNYSIKEIKIK